MRMCYAFTQCSRPNAAIKTTANSVYGRFIGVRLLRHQIPHYACRRPFVAGGNLEEHNIQLVNVLLLNVHYVDNQLY